jgi:hypothetical protein
VRVFLGRDPETNRVQLKERTIRGTKKDAERVLAELVAEADEGIGASAGGVTVAQLLDRWLEHNEADFSPKTVLEVRGDIRRTIVPVIGDRLVSEITTGVGREQALTRRHGEVPVPRCSVTGRKQTDKIPF